MKCYVSSKGYYKNQVWLLTEDLISLVASEGISYAESKGKKLTHYTSINLIESDSSNKAMMCDLKAALQKYTGLQWDFRA